MDNLVKITLKRTYYTSFAIYVCEKSYFRIFELGLDFLIILKWKWH